MVRCFSRAYLERQICFYCRSWNLTAAAARFSQFGSKSLSLEFLVNILWCHSHHSSTGRRELVSRSRDSRFLLHETLIYNKPSIIQCNLNSFAEKVCSFRSIPQNICHYSYMLLTKKIQDKIYQIVQQNLTLPYVQL